MAAQLDKILIVDDDPDVRALLREQVLDPSRFEVLEAEDGPAGLKKVQRSTPDMILLDIVMPGLSGHDFLVALKSQGYSGPVIVITKRGSEAAAIECFRLGATDYMTKPIREAEALQIIDHGLQEVRLRRERKELMDRLQTSNQQLETRLKAVTTLASVGKSVTEIFNLDQLFTRVLDAAVSLTGADHATLMLFDEESQRLILRAGKNMTLVMQEKMGEAVNDDIAKLVMTSGETLTAAGDTLKKYRMASDVLAVIYAPLTMQGKAIGVLTAGNHKKRRTFEENLSSLLEILAGYAAIAIANARLFTALERRAKSMEQAYEELKQHAAASEQTMNGAAALRQALTELQAEMKRTNANALPAPLLERLKAVSQRAGVLLNTTQANSK